MTAFDTTISDKDARALEFVARHRGKICEVFIAGADHAWLIFTCGAMLRATYRVIDGSPCLETKNHFDFSGSEFLPR